MTGDDDDDDDGLPNTYDYKDSFIDDTGKAPSDSDSSVEDPIEEDSDYEPDTQEITSLKTEARGFFRNKKLVKPVGRQVVPKPD